MKSRCLVSGLLGGVWLMLSVPVGAAVKLPAVIGNHMVLQRDVAAPIWGTAAPGEEVTVEFAGQKKTAVADADGKWLVRLDPLAVSAEPRAMAIASSLSPAGVALTLEDILVGEVWLGSGQSNMAGATATYRNRDSVLAANAAESYPLLRLFRGSWKASDSASNGGFSALMFSFGLRLQQESGIPFGLIVGAVGGTPSKRWLSPEMFQADPDVQALIEKAGPPPSDEEELERYKEALAEWERASKATEAEGKTVPRKPRAPSKMGDLYARMIEPVVPFAMRGVLWDQGEAGTQVAGIDQYTMMGALIGGWRNAWGQGDFPFLYVQKPSGGGCAWDPSDPVTSEADAFGPLPDAVPSNGRYREHHIGIRGHANTFMVTASDLGGMTHPVCKSGYGARAARVALGAVYGYPVEIYGPVYASHAVEGRTVRVRFSHVGQGMAFRHGDKLQGFAVAGADRQFRWADAVIDGDAVVVSCNEVSAPVAVRYGWAGSHPWANLFNRDGLPALAFRTDDW